MTQAKTTTQHQHQPEPERFLHILECDVLLSHLGQIDGGPPTQPSYLFRGQPDDSWSLKPSLVRKADEGVADKQRAHEVEVAALRQFQAQAHLHVSESVLRNTLSLLDWWPLMQHYLAPTRVLDWTYSPYVAAYFAAASHFKKDGAVWVLHVPTLKQVMGPRAAEPSWDTAANDAFGHPDNVPSLILAREPKIKTDRMVAQQGAFTVCTHVLEDHAAVLHATMPQNGPTDPVFQKVTFPADQKRNVLHKLRRMNITAASLFPGIDGLGRSIAELVDLGMRHW